VGGGLDKVAAVGWSLVNGLISVGRLTDDHPRSRTDGCTLGCRTANCRQIAGDTIFNSRIRHSSLMTFVPSLAAAVNAYSRRVFFQCCHSRKKLGTGRVGITLKIIVGQNFRLLNQPSSAIRDYSDISARITLKAHFNSVVSLYK